MAPELFKRECYDEKVDIWAVGVIAFLLLSGKKAFEGSDIRDLSMNVRNKQPDYSKLKSCTNEAR